MKLCRLLVFIIAATVIAACAANAPADDTDASGFGGAGGASVSSTTASTTAGSGGSGGEAPADTTETLRTYRACDRPSAVRPGLGEDGAVALGKFVPGRPSTCRAFRYEIVEGDAATGACQRFPHHVVAFVGSPDAPDESAEPVSIEVDPSSGGEQVIAFDPPLVVDAGAAAYVGVEMIMSSEDGWSCVATCKDLTMREFNFWSIAPWSEPAPDPWGWTPLFESPTPALGYHGDMKFELDCEPAE